MEWSQLRLALLGGGNLHLGVDYLVVHHTYEAAVVSYAHTLGPASLDTVVASVVCMGSNQKRQEKEQISQKMRKISQKIIS